jgi:hypothetical protein
MRLRALAAAEGLTAFALLTARSRALRDVATMTDKDLCAAQVPQ